MTQFSWITGLAGLALIAGSSYWVSVGMALRGKEIAIAPLQTDWGLPVRIARQSPSQLVTMERDIFQQVNQYRSQQGLPALKLDERMIQQARIHSQDMAEKRVPFGHQGFKQRVAAIAQTIPYRSAAENVAYNMGYRDPASQAVQGWIKSPGHQKNMVGQFDLTGIGVAQNQKGEYYFTQIFVQRR